jgi:PPK2 family polyphosphate:nucleotide phosphotransferase
VFKADPHPYLVPFEGGFKPSDAPTAPAVDVSDSKVWKKNLEEEKEKLGRWQHKLYADDRYTVLIVFQAMDAAGKDSTIRHVFTGVNPTGVRVTSFKRPSSTELNHDFLWRSVLALPERGTIGIFNRSYYEEVLVVRVHPHILDFQRLPQPIGENIWTDRYRSIVEHERHLAEQGIVILKFWLNVSKEEQRQRFLKRIERSNKRWKFSAGDLDEREHWNDYMSAYEGCLNATSQPRAPWYAIPADDKRFMRWQVAAIINRAFEQLNVDFPTLGPKATAELLESKARLSK